MKGVKGGVGGGGGREIHLEKNSLEGWIKVKEDDVMILGAPDCTCHQVM